MIFALGVASKVPDYTGDVAHHACDFLVGEAFGAPFSLLGLYVWLSGGRGF